MTREWVKCRRGPRISQSPWSGSCQFLARSSTSANCSAQALSSPSISATRACSSAIITSPSTSVWRWWTAALPIRTGRESA